MKIREDFVTNSSSSSYILALKATKMCRCCKLTPPGIIEYINQNSNSSCGASNEVDAHDTAAVVRWLESAIEDLQDQIFKERRYPPTDPAYPGATNYTRENHIDKLLEDVKWNQDMIKKVRKAGTNRNVVLVQLNYHDDFAHELLKKHKILWHSEG